MNKTFFTSDLHLGHKNLVKYYRKEFDTVEEMNECIISNINLCCNRNDNLYILGDFTMYHAYNYIKDYREKINCRNVYLVKGNHDSRTLKSYQEIFKYAYDQVYIKVGDQKIFLNHYPMLEWQGSSKNSWHLHGHSHGNSQQRNRLCFDVGVDSHSFIPWSFEEVKVKMERIIESGLNDVITFGDFIRTCW